MRIARQPLPKSLVKTAWEVETSNKLVAAARDWADNPLEPMTVTVKE